MNLATVATFANVYRSIGLVLAAIVVVAVAVYAIVNVLFGGKAEIGSELEIAPNRKEYFDDETLEGPKLDRALTWGLLTLFVLAVGLPLYWVMEPARQANAAGDFGRKFRERGEHLFAPTGDNEQALNCAFCHGGMEAEGAVIPYNLADPATGDVTPVDWRAPALNTVLLRYSREEVTYILVYGRPGTPMPAWGIDGGGPLNDQQVQNLVDYLESIQISPEEAQQAVADELEEYMASGEFESEGEALFNMGILGEGNSFAGGAYACARCHTSGWSYAETYADIPEEARGCGGALGPNLCDGATARQFPSDEDHAEFVTVGSEDGIGYGTRGQGSGKMPGFGLRPPEDPLYWLNGGEPRDFPIESVDGETVNSGMLTPEMIEAIVEYERGL